MKRGNVFVLVIILILALLFCTLGFLWQKGNNKPFMGDVVVPNTNDKFFLSPTPSPVPILDFNKYITYKIPAGWSCYDWAENSKGVNTGNNCNVNSRIESNDWNEKFIGWGQNNFKGVTTTQIAIKLVSAPLEPPDIFKKNIRTCCDPAYSDFEIIKIDGVDAYVYKWCMEGCNYVVTAVKNKAKLTINFTADQESELLSHKEKIMTFLKSIKFK